tara:strand:+ start:1180 stop:1407 length:228 start_codon:yes stop_codon:yes gene_type:complete
MPIWLRRFTYQEISGIKNQEREANEAAIKKSKIGKKGSSIDLANPNKSKIPKQAFSPPTTRSKSPPTYTTRASKK